MDCLFCKFINKELKTDIVYEDENMLIFKDIAPQAKRHYLMVVKSHFKYLADMTENDSIMLARALKKLPELTELLGLEGGYRLVINQGDDAGQTVPHVHVHILCGQKMGWTPA